MVDQKCMINPTGGKIRIDAAGSGLWNAHRGPRRHAGLDFICSPGQSVVSPITGKVIRTAMPYKNGPYTGIVIENEWVRIKIFYLLPIRSVIGKKVAAGDIVGTAQDISAKYGPAMIPHIHLEIDGIDPAIFLTSS